MYKPNKKNIFFSLLIFFALPAQFYLLLYGKFKNHRR